MDAAGLADDDVIAEGKERLAQVDDEGVTFTSHLDGSRHRFTPESSMQIQHQLGADIIFAFDECTTLMNTREYQERRWRGPRPGQSAAWLSTSASPRSARTGPSRPCSRVIQGAQYEDLRRQAGSRPGVAGRRPAGASPGTASAARWRRRTSAPSSDGAPPNCRSTSRGTCSASPSRRTSSPRSRTVRTPSTASSRRGSPATPRSTPSTADTTSPPPLPARLLTDRPRVRLLHLRELHPGVPASSVQGQGNAGLDAVHHPQRAVHRLAGRPDPGQHRQRHVRRACEPTSWVGTTPLANRRSATPDRSEPPSGAVPGADGPGLTG